jgi:hypothetical protein
MVMLLRGLRPTPFRRGHRRRLGLIADDRRHCGNGLASLDQYTPAMDGELRMKKYQLPIIVVALISFFTSADIRPEFLSRMERRYLDLRARRGRLEAFQFLLSEGSVLAASAVLFHVRIQWIIDALIHLFKVTEPNISNGPLTYLLNKFCLSRGPPA